MSLPARNVARTRADEGGGGGGGGGDKVQPFAALVASVPASVAAATPAATPAPAHAAAAAAQRLYSFFRRLPVGCCYWLLLLLAWADGLEVASATSSSSSSSSASSAVSIGSGATHNGSPILNRHQHQHNSQLSPGHVGGVEDEGYWREIKAIVGGVLGFWGGVGGMGSLFLVIVLSQRYCCRKDDDEKDGEG